MHIAFLHTGEIHVGTFDALLDQLGFSGTRTHTVREDFLDRARAEGLDAVREEIADQLNELSGADSVLCTCSTLGPVTDEVAGQLTHVVRIDRPMMEKACRLGENVAVAVCLESTITPSVALLEQCAREAGLSVRQQVVMCDGAWSWFEKGDQEAFAGAIAGSIRSAVDEADQPPDSIVLAQATMRVAEGKLEDIGVPVLSSPMLAASRAVHLSQTRRG